MLQIVEQACKLAPDNSRLDVVIESSYGNGEFGKAFEELQSPEARNVAMKFGATRGFGQPRINGNLSGAYPINSEGLSLDNIRDAQGNPLPQTDPRMQPVRYRIDVPICNAF